MKMDPHRRRIAGGAPPVDFVYVERGYLNSGAVIPDQRVEDGVVRIQIIEGRLSEVEVTGDTHLSAGYVQDRLGRSRKHR